MSGAFAAWRWLIVLLVGLLLLGLVSVIFSNTDPASDSGPALRTGSNRPNGARALLVWLEDLGYHTSTNAFREFSVDPATRVLFVLRPTEAFEDDALAEIAAWVQSGGILIMAADTPNALMSDWGVHVLRQTLGTQHAAPRQPVFLDPPVHNTRFEGFAVLTLNHTAWTPLISTPGDVTRPLLAVRHVGNGTVYALSDPFIFSNRAIGDLDHAALVLNLLSDVPAGSQVTFDEYHHGLTEHGTLNARLLREPWGWAIIYVAVTFMLYLAFSGRRFGRAAPHAPIAALRSRAEYVATMGALLRRGNHTAWLRTQYAIQIKRALGARFQVRADQPARDFATAIGLRGGDISEIGPLLERLESSYTLSEQETIELMRDVERVTNRLTG